VKRLFTIVSLLAIVHVAALAGTAAYAWSQGWMTKDRVLGAVAVLRDEDVDTGDSSGEEVIAEEAPKSAGELIQRNVAVEERSRIELARREREIEDSWRLLETQQLAFLREKEDFKAAKRRLAEEREAQAKREGDSGLKKEMEILSGIKSKEAKELLKQKNDADVVRILMAMENRQARKIVSACKTNEERLWIGRILGQLHERNAAQAEALGAGS